MKLSNRPDKHCCESSKSGSAKQEVVLARYLVLALEGLKHGIQNCIAQSGFDRELPEGDSRLGSTLNSGGQLRIQVARTQICKKLEALGGGSFPERKRIEYRTAADRHHRRKLTNDEAVSRNEQQWGGQTKLGKRFCPRLKLFAAEEIYCCDHLRRESMQVDTRSSLQRLGRRKQRKLNVHAS